MSDHDPALSAHAPDSSVDSASQTVTSASAPKASRLGLVLFVVYLLLYGGFVLLNAFDAETMETIVFAGLNLAIVYGFGLILVAIGMSLIYGLKTVDEAAATEASE
ncbi:DUF485 domain-containing protein [Rhodopirellula halodulae]|uniref:DUF485 domain-containing protein n=1 Tax=Rhodopirellula halodulae TaxID=2894198 RepID=UPI001E2E408E|nr:DUF485 domain-containing protein [Rhodopirellula sp. JC737]MCC9656061.1 DUF485 domain-containing protein [Rhodopirellula sp. JC737]